MTPRWSNIGWVFGCPVNDSSINGVFHRLCLFLDKKEREYFEAHDEYSILKKRFLTDACRENFGFMIGSSADGEIHVLDNEYTGRSHTITMDELKAILEAREKLKEYTKVLSEELHKKS